MARRTLLDFAVGSNFVTQGTKVDCPKSVADWKKKIRPDLPYRNSDTPPGVFLFADTA